MKRITILFLFLSGLTAVIAQQTPSYTQFVLHDYLINPAVVGTRDYYDAKMTNRLQWTGIEEAPRTSVLSAQGPLKNRKMGLGGYFISDRAGHIKQQGMYFTYSYIVKMEGVKLSFGMSAGIQSYGVDGTKLNLNETGDQVLSNGLQTSWVPDGSFGILFFNDRLRAGFSINQLYGTKLNFFESGNEGTSSLTQHFNVHGSYLIGNKENQFTFLPYFLMKYVGPSPAQFDLGAQVIYQNSIWIGGAYRTDEAFSILFGFIVRDNLTFGYSYDVITSDISIRAKQTHELVLGIKLQRALPKKM